MLTTLILTAMLSALPVEGKPVPFCQDWNTMGNMDGGEPVSPTQRKMFHLGHFLTKSDFVRIQLNKQYKDGIFVDQVITCYEENTPILVEEVDEICRCSSEDKRDKVNEAFNSYLNDCIKEVKVTGDKP